MIQQYVLPLQYLVQANIQALICINLVNCTQLSINTHNGRIL